MIVTLAGHVDHGKTSLVKSLTGVETDRLEQEKQRGLTIDLGFAYMDDGAIGFVDVPGHHKFIHNMVAGVASHQYTLLVIAADDGPMPQSKEHLDILSLVGIRHGVIALTKVDRVDSNRINDCKQEIAQLVQGSFMEGALVIETSIEDPASIETLKTHLRQQQKSTGLLTDEKPFRLAVDRAFNIKGSGLVVTGTVHSGTVQIDDILHHNQRQETIRVRSIRAQDQNVSQATTGDRCALNLSGLSLDQVTRGDWLEAMPPSQFKQATLELSVLSEFPRPVKHWTPVHIYHATSHMTGRIALLNDERIAPGSDALVDLVCDEPINVRHGDQVVLRDQSLDLTLGGGRVIHATPNHTRRRRQAERLTRLQHFCTEKPEDCLTLLLKEQPVELKAFADIWQLNAEQLDALIQPFDVIQIAGLAVARPYLSKLQQKVLSAVREHQEKHPSSPGLKENAFADVPKVIRQRLLNALVQANALVNSGGHFHLPNHQETLPDDLAAAWKKLEPALNHKQAPSTGDLAKQWRIPQQQIETQLKALAKRGYVVHLANHRFYLPAQLDGLVETIKLLASQKPFSVKEFRDETGIGRNIAIEILEHFDRKGLTRRQGNERVVLKTYQGR